MGIDDNLVEFLKYFETYDVDRVVPVYQEIALSFIRDRHRSAYRQATAWLQAIRDAWASTNRRDAWRNFIKTFQRKYYRLPALQDELRKAGLV